MKIRQSATRAMLIVLLCLLAEAVAQACPICFQIDDHHTVNGVRAAVGVLIGVTTVVLAGFGVFATRFVRREAGASRNP